MVRRPAVRAVVAALAALLALAGPAAARPRAPHLQSPKNGKKVQALPPLTWRAVRGASYYEVQVASDRRFSDLVSSRRVQTANTAWSPSQAYEDGPYFWHVRAVTKGGDAGRWSRPRRITKAWTARPKLLAPVESASLGYPHQALTLKWKPVAGAANYRVYVATDASLTATVLPDRAKYAETLSTEYTVPTALAPGRYYWAVAPVDGQRHVGRKASAAVFQTSWASGVGNLLAGDLTSDPKFSWTPVPGATGYDVEINYSHDWAASSKVCCSDRSYATTVSPSTLLANNTYYWRVRAVDPNGNAGGWTEGPVARKVFDASTPSIPGLRIRDNVNDVAPMDTSDPVVAWDAVTGASSYEVQIAPWQSGAGCGWTTPAYDLETTNTAWSPVDTTPGHQPGGATWPSASKSAFRLDSAVAGWCARVLAIAGKDGNGNEVASEWTQLGSAAQPAFHYVDPAVGSGGSPALADGDYLSPRTGTVARTTPLFTWRRVPGARTYWVVISRDASFTNVAELAFTRVAAYAPRKALTDETSHYYWAVLPSPNADGSFPTDTSANSPQSFDKASLPPDQQSPLEGQPVGDQPQFRWSAAAGALQYRLQVATDAGFSDLKEDKVTAATSYTPTAFYPVDTVLYWRVRAIDGSNNGLTWSPTRTFRRSLPAPALDPLNPRTGGLALRTFAWSPVQGAASYDVLITQSDGTPRTLHTPGSAFTPTRVYGRGTWNWQVRAVFPGATPGPWTAKSPYTRSVPAPAGARARRSGARTLLSWKPSASVDGYRVEVSGGRSFGRVIEGVTTDLTSWAPSMRLTAYRRAKRLYWRVAAVDGSGRPGAFATGQIKRGRTTKARAKASAITVTSATGRASSPGRGTLRGD